MELAESIETINKFLATQYGKDANNNMPIWRVVWAPDQREKRETHHTAEGLQLLSPVVAELPKYQWIGPKYVLERLVIVPEFQQRELGGIMLSYEPIWVFETQAGVYLPPRIDVSKIVIDSIYAVQGKGSLRKYVDPEAAEPLESRKARIDGIVEELFGNETPTGDALAHKTGEFFDSTKQPMNHSNRPLITEK